MTTNGLVVTSPSSLSQKQQLNKEEGNNSSKYLETLVMTTKEKPQFEYFIFTEEIYGQIVNQMFRFASLYAFGQMLNRTPVFSHNDILMRDYEAKLRVQMPNFYKKIYFLKNKIDQNKIKRVELAKTCCVYSNPEILFEYKEFNGLMLTGGIQFENYLYFDHIRKKILNLFEFGQRVYENVALIKNRLNDFSHKMCVHTPFSDYVGLGDTAINQIGEAIQYLRNFLPRIVKSRIHLYSLLLFGMEKKYINSLKNVYNESLFDNIHFMVDLEMSRLEELHFAQKSCDSLLLTASLTANAFWMGYLMPEDKPIFFVRKKWQLNRYGKNFYLDSRENLPSDWITIEEEWLHKH
uniref:Uncharacterized protein n=1 Tax=Meloidogyne enterolobii TaxID=390850 RepID=A0A6V7TJA5_MELEN|nr:unnamed protein product [Meloidogyne enterolobii]